MDFNSELNKRIEYCNNVILNNCPNGDEKFQIIFDSQNYSLLSGGKRLRPLLLYSVCEMLNGDISLTDSALTAIECIHTYSLIHDDLPCMDNDDLRRGKPTNHKKFGETIAVLAGDSLLNYAFEILGKSKTKPEVTVKLLRELSTSSGANGMIGGQVLDINTVNNIEDLKYMYSLKTGMLLKASVVMGAICAECDDDSFEKLTEFAKYLGLAFQIKDDLLDIFGDEEVFGKPIGSDDESEKFTFVKCLGVEKAQEMVGTYSNKAINILSEFKNSEFLIELTKYLINRNK